MLHNSGHMTKRGFSLIVAALAITSCMPAESKAVELSCALHGKQSIGSAEQICSVFQKKIDASLPGRTQLVKSFAAQNAVDAIDLDVRIANHGGIVAHVKKRKNGVVQNFPEIAIDVMDRPLAMRDIDMLASEIAKLVSVVLK